MKRIYAPFPSYSTSISGHEASIPSCLHPKPIKSTKTTKPTIYQFKISLCLVLFHLAPSSAPPFLFISICTTTPSTPTPSTPPTTDTIRDRGMQSTIQSGWRFPSVTTEHLASISWFHAEVTFHKGREHRARERQGHERK